MDTLRKLQGEIKMRTNELEYYKRLTEQYKNDILQLTQENKELSQIITKYEIKLKCILEPKKEYYIIDDNSIKYLDEVMSWKSLCDTLNYLLEKIDGSDGINNILDTWDIRTPKELDHVLSRMEQFIMDERGITVIDLLSEVR